MDRNFLPLILAAAAITYGTRLAGLGLGDRAVPADVRRFLGYVPIAAFTALIVPGIGGAGDESVPRLAAGVVAVLVVLRLQRLWACLVVGLAVYWLARWVV
jgi:branched-subunit amino acid transport protein